MKLIYAVMDEDHYVVESNGQEVRLLTSQTEVNTGYGFESPEPDNQWISGQCGIRVYRKYLYFSGDYCVAVFEPAGNTHLNHGFVWTDQLPGDSGISAALLLSKNGRQSKTAPWMREHGIAQYLDWAKTVLTQMGYSVQETIQQIKNAYISSIFRILTNAGFMYLKITSSVYVNTAAKEKQLTDSMGGTPVFVAVSPDGYAAITKEMPGHDCQAGDAGQYKSWLESWGEKQAQTTGENTYGLTDCSPQKLLTEIVDFERQANRIIFEVTNRSLSEADRSLLSTKLADVKTSLERLCQYPIPNTLCHADTRPGNVRIMEDMEIFYDWGMAFYGHPFYDALHFLHVVRRQLSEKQKAEIIDAYLSKWERYGDKQMLQDAYTQAERCKEYFMLTADCRWVAEILDVCGGIPPKGTIDNWLLDKRYYYFDRVLHRFISE